MCAAPMLVLFGIVSGPPTLESISPLGLQRGKPTVLTLRGSGWNQSSRLILACSAKQRVIAADGGSCRIECTLSADAATGTIPVFAATNEGVGGPSPLVVGAIAEITADPASTSAPTGQPIALPTTVNGVLKERGIHWFQFLGRKGERVVAEVAAQRLGSNLDPTLTLLDADGTPLKVAEDTPGLDQDSRIAVALPADGLYRLKLHDAAFAAGGPYRLNVGDFALPAEVFPLGGRRNETASIRLAGGTLAAAKTVPIRLDDQDRAGRCWLSGESFGPPGTPGIWLDVDDLPERDAGPTPIIPPCVVNGRFRGGAETVFQVSTKPGRTLRGEVRCASLGQNADPVLRWFVGNQMLATGDDQVAPTGPNTGRRPKDSADPLAVATTPNGAEQIALGVGDLFGSRAAYRLRIDLATPRFDAAAKTPSLFLAPGGSASLELSIRRERYKGPIEIRLVAAPPGWSIRQGKIPAGGNDVTIVVLAPAAFAAPVRLHLLAVADVENKPVQRSVHHEVVWRQVRQTVVAGWDLNRILAVPSSPQEAAKKQHR